MRLAVPVLFLAGVGGCCSSRAGAPALSDREWLVPIGILEARAQVRAREQPAPVTDAAPRPAIDVGAVAYHFPRTNLVKQALETSAGRYLASMTRYQLGDELGAANPLPGKRIVFFPSWDGSQLRFVLRVRW